MSTDYTPKLGYGFLVPEDKEEDAYNMILPDELELMYTGNSVVGIGHETFIVTAYHEASDDGHTVIDFVILSEQHDQLVAAATVLGIEKPELKYYFGMHVG